MSTAIEKCDHHIGTDIIRIDGPGAVNIVLRGVLSIFPMLKILSGPLLLTQRLRTFSEQKAMRTSSRGLNKPRIIATLSLSTSTKATPSEFHPEPSLKQLVKEQGREKHCVPVQSPKIPPQKTKMGMSIALRNVSGIRLDQISTNTRVRLARRSAPIVEVHPITGEGNE